MADISTGKNSTATRRGLRSPLSSLAKGRLKYDREGLKDLFILVGLPVVLVIAAFWIAARYIKPAPPSNFVMTTGADGGAYHLYAQRYRDILNREKIAVTLKPSAGSLENVKRLLDDNSAVEVGLVQAGVASAAEVSSLRSLGAFYYEPLWVFYRGSQSVDKLSQLAGKRIAIGPEGSGTRALALQLLKASGVEDSPSNFSPLGGSEAATALLDHAVDAVLLVAAPDAPVVQKLNSARDVKLASLIQADAFTRRFPFLTALQLPRGVLDLAGDLPARDVTLLATTAHLVVKEDFHPALGYLLLQAASEVHGHGGVLQKSGEFPAPRESEFALSDEAKRYYRSGTPFLQRYLPFWVANFIERMAVLLLPLIAVLLPLFKVLPAVIQWRNKSRLFKWYGELRHLESKAAGNLDREQLRDYLQRLDEIETGVSLTRVGSHYSDYVYNLRLHIDLVRQRLRRFEAQEAGTTVPRV
jgi:TRAP transporter TAXI family solute receptor